MQEIRTFLSKILTAQSITKEIREEALQLRDSLSLGVVTELGINVKYPGPMSHQNNVPILMKDIKACEIKARATHVEGVLRPIPFIKQLRSHYCCDLQEAKKLSDWLRHNEIVTMG
jgi:hypothetical protein